MKRTEHRMNVNRFLKPSAIWLAAVFGALAVGVAGARVFNNSQPSPSAMPFDEVTQSASAVSKGVELDAIGASFSGSETLLRFKVTVKDEDALRSALGVAGSIQRIAPSGTYYSGPFGGAPLTSTMNKLGETVLILPPLQAPIDYDGTFVFNVTGVTVYLDSRPVLLEGDWPLKLNGPHPAELEARLRREEFNVSNLTTDGREARAYGFRTVSETRVSIDLPDGVTMLTQAVLRVDGKRIPPRSFGNEGNTVTTSFPATAFGAAVEIELGAIAKFNGEPVVITVSMKEALAQAKGAGTFDIPAAAVLAGDPKRVLGGEQGTYSSRRWVGLEVVGNWQSADPADPPQIIDGRGVQLQRAHLLSGYRKDVNGVVSEGTSKVAAFITDDTDLGQITLVLSPSTVPDGQTYIVALHPE